MSDEQLIAFALAWPAVGALLVWALGRWPNAHPGDASSC